MEKQIDTEKVVESHKEEYGRAPDVIAVAPGRVHLIGEHTWFFKDKTLSMAVNLPVCVALSRRDDANLHFHFVQLKERKRASLSLLKLRKEDKWANVLKAVMYGFVSGGFECGGLDLTISAAMLPSAGFGITTALKVAFTWGVRELFRLRCPEPQLFRLLERANKGFLGMENFLADNFTAVCSKEQHLVLTDHERGTCDLIPFKYKDWTVILTDAKVPRVTTWNEESLQQPENVLLLGELKERRSSVYGGWHYEDSGASVAEVLSVVGEDVRRHLTCIMNEHKYVLEAEAALRKADFPGFARAVNRSHENMRDLYDISSPEVDWILKRVQALEENPVDLRQPMNCGRITGKGMGRSLYAIVRKDSVEKYHARLAEYERIFGFSPESWQVAPAKGVRLL